MKQMMCYLCGRDAKFQLKNGKWCCSKNARSCPAIKNKIRSHMIQRWKEVKTEGKRNLNTNKKPEQRLFCENQDVRAVRLNVRFLIL